MGMCVPTDDYKSMKQFIINIGEYLMEMMQLVKKAIKVYGFVKITDDDGRGCGEPGAYSNANPGLAAPRCRLLG